ncbi:hypothetical protein [uncultured Desulfovibrio sp.]|uniref:hypothetical protein n=1 Tax=uncultured Desulfovibrio sp. TaxID=167968 RepID=UPI0028689C01|nr:hypothetical protein [uncultured Desulfovibrio sp.]
MLINPRITDYHGIQLSQEKTDFAIPFLNEDIPLYVDPFLLWKSPSYQDNSLHSSIMNIMNDICLMHKKNSNNRSEAIQLIVNISECSEVGLGTSLTRKGKKISSKMAAEILDSFLLLDSLGIHGFDHLEEIQFLVQGFSKDRLSDFSCNLMKSFLIDYTVDQCDALSIPCENVDINNIYSLSKRMFCSESVKLPVNPENKSPILFVPKRFLRFIPWIDFDEYFKASCPYDDDSHHSQKFDRVKVLKYNRDNYDQVKQYIQSKERTAQDCKNDPLFRQLPVTSVKRKFSAIKALPLGTTDLAHRKYEDNICALLSTLFYPKLDFAKDQSRTESGSSIRDLIFYNTRAHKFLDEIFNDYGSKQIVFELKNVKEVAREHVDQLNRYLGDNLGKFGVLVTRNELSKARRKQVVDLWSGQRKCIITLTDMDIEQMVDLFESHQRDPFDVLIKKYIEFKRSCPN